MRIQIEYDTGRVDTLDTSNLVASQPLGGASIATELSLRTDLLAQEGLVLDIHHHDKSADDSPDVPYADRCRGWRVCLAEREDLEHVESISADGRDVAWQQGGALVDAAKFERAVRRCYSGPPYASTNMKACALFEYLSYAHPDLAADPAAICALFGFPIESFLDAKRAEEAQPMPEEGGD